MHILYFRMENLDRMFELGIYITDLSMHDVSRDLILVGTQQSNELSSALEQVRQIRAELIPRIYFTWTIFSVRVLYKQTW